MKCANCDFDNPEMIKFCGHCGAPLCEICSSCGYSNPVQFRFCGNCGIPLSQLQTSDNLAKLRKYMPSYLAEKIQQTEGNILGERRNVTVVFSDISGFTALAETRDPEEVAAIATVCHTMMGRVIYEYDGVVDKIVGDGLMSIFGIPTRENDPERAILAAIEMQQVMKELSQELYKSIGVSLGISVGINTGVVIIGDIGNDLIVDHTVIGDVVNTASRVEGKAEAGEILVTEETYRRTNHFFDFAVLEPVRVKGKSHPINVYKVTRQKEKPLRIRGITGLDSPLIGREEEYASCQQAVDELLTGKGRTLLVVGDAGHGKSRLASELRQYAEARQVVCIEGRCVPHSHSINYSVFVDALRNHFAIEDKDDEIETRRKIAGKVSCDIGEVIISSIGSLISSKVKTQLGTEDLEESERKLRLFTSVKDALALESRTKPLILMLDDLHWADELSVELLLFLMDSLSNCRVTFVCIYRPPIKDGPDLQPIEKLEASYLQSKSTGVGRYTRITLNPLSSGDSDKLLGSLLTVSNLPEEVKKLILGKAAGNPLYLEEVIRSVIEEKAIEHRDGKWFAAKQIEDIQVPSSIQDVIMARIDRLREESKNVLQCAAVSGQSFEYDLLSYLLTGGMASDKPQISGENKNELLQSVLPQKALKINEARSLRRIYGHELNEHLEKLEDMGFISREDGDRPVYRFRHLLVQEVAYNSTLIRRRRKLHEMIGNYIVETNSSCLDGFYEILAYHYSNSGNTELALSYMIKAGDKNTKISTGSAQSALQYFRMAMDVLNSSSYEPNRRAVYEQSIYRGTGEANKDLGRYEDALSSFEKVLRAAERTRDFRMRAEALRQIANNKTQMGDWDAGLKAYEESLAIVRELGDLSQVGFVYNCIGYGYFERGEHDEAMNYFQEASKIGKQCGDPRLVADASNGLGMLASVRYDLDEAIRNYQISLKSYREIEESHYEAQAYQNLGIAHFKKGEIKVADKYYEDSLKISEKCGYIRLKAYTYLSRAELHLWESNLDRAIEFCEAAFQILETLDDKWARAEGYKFYGMIYRRKGNLQLARESLQTSLRISEECENLMNLAEVYFEMGLIHKDEGSLKNALGHFSRARDIFAELGITEEIQKIDAYIAEAGSARIKTAS